MADVYTGHPGTLVGRACLTPSCWGNQLWSITWTKLWTWWTMLLLEPSSLVPGRTWPTSSVQREGGEGAVIMLYAFVVYTVSLSISTVLRTQSSIQNAVSAPATVSFKDVIEKMVHTCVTLCFERWAILHTNCRYYRLKTMGFSLCQSLDRRDTRANCYITLDKLCCSLIEEWCL